MSDLNAVPSEPYRHPYQHKRRANVMVCECGKWPLHHVHTGDRAACTCDECVAPATSDDVYLATAERYYDLVGMTPEQHMPMTRTEMIHWLVNGDDEDECDQGARWFRAAVDAARAQRTAEIVAAIRAEAATLRDYDGIPKLTALRLADMIERRCPDCGLYGWVPPPFVPAPRIRRAP